MGVPRRRCVHRVAVLNTNFGRGAVLDGLQGGNAPRGILVGHAIEAALKSYLALRGWQEKRLWGLGHVLAAAWKAARAEGLDILPHPPRWLRGLSFKHDALQYRYPDAGSELWLPRTDLFMDTVEHLIETVERHFPPPRPFEDSDRPAF